MKTFSQNTLLETGTRVIRILEIPQAERQIIKTIYQTFGVWVKWDSDLNHPALGFAEPKHDQHISAKPKPSLLSCLDAEHTQPQTRAIYFNM